MWKRIMAVILIFVLCVSVMWFANPLAPVTKVSADTYRSGFSIIPEKEDASGVLLDSGFILSSQSELTIDYIKENVSMRGGEMFTITPAAEGRFILKTTEPLEQNKIYFIDVKAQAGNTVSFAFQTKRDFTVLGSLPDNMSSYVPVDTGIELYFSYPDVENISKHFEITPKVNGRFETNGYTTVFIPKELKAGTIYTVTIKKGLTAADKSVSLAEDYTFSFETSPDEKSTADPYKGDLYINRGWIEYGTTEVPAVGFDLYLRDRIDSAEVTLNLYRFETLDDFIKAIRKKEETPYWAYYASSRNRIDTSKLENVLEFKQSFNLQRWQQKYMMFPKALEHGYYLVELSTDELSTQAFLQISDITAYTITDKDNTLFWLNDLITKAPVKGTEVFDFELGKGFLSDSSGLVKIPNFKENKDDSGVTQKLYRVTTTAGNVSIINAGYPYYDTYRDNGSLNWRYIQTDRTLYKPNDTVEFWGFIKSRIDDTYPNDITVELASGGYYYPMRSNIMSRFLPFLSNPLETLELKTEGGFYEGNIKLPQLDPGSYTITVKDGDKILSSSYFRVENYIKPQYKLEITSEKKAVFVGEEITFKIKASFFDGTPVANVPLNYYINGYNDNINGQGVTDKNGILEIKHTPKYHTNMQGESYAGINISAQFPETGEINEYYNFRVFANDINIQSKGEIKDNKGTIDFTVNEVVLDTLNDDDNTNDNYLGKAVAGQKLSLSLVHRTWEKIETGDEYDAINKVVRKTYEYREKKTPAGTATLTTGHDGTARYEFSVKPNDEGYYTAEVITSDTNNRTIKNEIWVYNNSGHRGYPNDYEYFMLKTDKESYKAGETVNAQIINNKDEPLKDMPTLFVEARNGIQNYQVVGQPALSMAFPEDYAPNYYLHGIAFNGKSYIRTNASIIYDYNEKKIDLSIKTDKDAYKPGDNMTISLEAKDINGKPVPAKVNISLVDEALLKLSGQYIDPLAQLYSWIGDGIISSASTRDDSGGPIRLAAGGAEMTVAQEAKSDAAMPAPSAAPESPAAAMDNGQSVSVRSEFKDTALFKTITLSPNGLGSYTFKLPDNVTSFSLAAAAVSADLYAGSEIQSAKVTMPFFINDALSLDYLEGDKPYVGLTAYGDGLDENEKVNFELTIKELPLYNKTAEAKVYERVNLPLPTLTEGIFTVIMTARSESGKADALSRTITVYNSYRTIETVKQNKVTAGMKLEAGKSGITTLIFTDAGRGSLISALHNLSWEYGKRLDQKLVSNYARSLLKELIKNDAYYIEPIEVNPAEYKNEDGGYGILPYAGSDISFTALITPLLKDVIDTAPLKMYFYNAVMSEKGVQAAALFALAELGEPVLLDLNRAAQVENLSLDEYIYLGMAYEALGDFTKANEIYLKRISPALERKDPYIRVKVKKNDTDTSYRQTALVAAYAARINSPDASKLFAFVQNNYSKTQYVGVEKALYLSEMVDNLPDTNASVSYTMGGKAYDVELSNGFSEVVKVPSININDLKITKVTGDVSVLSLFTGSFTDNVQNDSGLTLSRKYYDAATGKEKTTFAADDLVKVEITYTIDKSAIDNTYEISDYAPAGLKPLDNPWSYGVRDALGCWYRQFDGQKVTFVVGKYDEKYPPKPLVYYARVASPGEYIAEGSIAQGSMVKSSIVTIKDAKIVIEP